MTNANTETKTNTVTVETATKAVETMEETKKDKLDKSVEFVTNGRKIKGWDLISNWMDTGNVLIDLKAIAGDDTTVFSHLVNVQYGEDMEAIAKDAKSYNPEFSHNDRAYCQRLARVDNLENQSVEMWYTENDCTLASPKGVFEKMQKDDSEFGGLSMILESMTDKEKETKKTKDAKKKLKESAKKDATKVWEALVNTMDSFFTEFKTDIKANDDLKAEIVAKYELMVKNMNGTAGKNTDK